MATYKKMPTGPIKYQPAPSQYVGVRPPAAPDISSIGPRPTTDFFGGSGVGDIIRRANEFKAWEEKKRNLEAGTNPDGSPMAPEFVSMIDPETGRLKGGLQMNLEGVPGYEQYGAFATGTGPSQYAEAATNELGLKANLERDRATREAQQAYGMARGQMARGPGITRGASERLGSQAMTNAMEGRQMARQGEMTGLTDILTKDALGRQQALQDYTKMGAGAEQFNLGAALDEINAERGAAWDTYKEKGGMWAAGKKAKEMSQNQGGGGGMCFITTACCEVLGLPDDNAILNTFRDFRDDHLGGKEGVSEYYELAPKIVRAMKEKDELDMLYDVIGMYLLPCHRLIKRKEFDRAYEVYGIMFTHLKEKYLGESNGQEKEG